MIRAKAAPQARPTAPSDEDAVSRAWQSLDRGAGQAPDLARLAEAAGRVAEAAGERERAYSEEQAAEAALLVALVDAVRPALRSLGTRRGLLPDPERRTLWVAGYGDADGAGEEQCEVSVYLDEGGHFWELSAHPSGAGSLARVVSPEVVAREWRVEAIAERLQEALRQQEEGATGKRVRQARERAERLRALVALLKGGA